jgi:hypothetical protein
VLILLPSDDRQFCFPREPRNASPAASPAPRMHYEDELESSQN